MAYPICDSGTCESIRPWGHLVLGGETRAVQVLMRMISFLQQNLLEIQTYVSILQQIIQTTPQASAIAGGMWEVRIGMQAIGNAYLKIFFIALWA